MKTSNSSPTEFDVIVPKYEEWETPVRREWVWDEWEDKEDQANALSLRNKETPKKTYCPKIPDAGEVFKPDPDMEL